MACREFNTESDEKGIEAFAANMDSNWPKILPKEFEC